MEKKIEDKLVTVENDILIIRGQKVLLDSDVAALYGVETRRINEAVKNNPSKFPKGYIITLTESEFNFLRSKISTAKMTKSRVAPKAFTEKGLYMLATVLKSPDAVEATFAIIETFSKLRELARTMERLNEENVPVAELKTLKARSNKLFKDVFTDPLPLKMRKTKFSFNFGIMNISIETVREQPE
jgi:hypothetical protein